MCYGMGMGDYEGDAVLIKSYVKKDGVWVYEIEEGIYGDINVRDYTWRTIPERHQSGWVQDNHPPEPQIIASKGMLKEANKILKRVAKEKKKTT